MKNLALAFAALSLCLPAAHAAEDFRPFGIPLDVPGAELGGTLYEDGFISFQEVPTPNKLLTSGYAAELNADGIVCRVTGAFSGSAMDAFSVAVTLQAQLKMKYPSITGLRREWDQTTTSEVTAYRRGELVYYATATEELPYPLTKIHLASSGVGDTVSTWINYEGATPCNLPATEVQQSNEPTSSSGL